LEEVTHATLTKKLHNIWTTVILVSNQISEQQHFIKTGLSWAWGKFKFGVANLEGCRAWKKFAYRFGTKHAAAGCKVWVATAVVCLRAAGVQAFPTSFASESNVEGR
jgi:hypothetical protein